MHFWDDYETELSIRKLSNGMSELSHVFFLRFTGLGEQARCAPIRGLIHSILI